VIVDNRPGGGANIGAEIAVRSAPDGYTLLMASTAHSINASLYPKMTYDPIKDFTPITVVAETAQVLVVHPSIPSNTIKELIEYLKNQTNPISYSSAGNGSQPHLSTELFKMMSGTKMTHVPYKGGPQAMTDLMAGHVQLSLATAPSAVQNVKSGKVKALGVSTRQRISALPDVPTIHESGLSGYEAIGYFGLVGPAQLPVSIVNKINAMIIKIVREPAMTKYLSEQGADPLTSSPAEYAKLIRDEVDKWGKVVKATGAQID
jgi:tripartite-type tricarboxylate transporter receptor subunit TctC